MSNELKSAEPRRIGEISNYYGGLYVKEEMGHCFWGIENHNGIGWEEIPKWLYMRLIFFQNNNESRNND